ncbi:Poc4p SCDLUD_002138 [Saccharomycodes ludwigii]|uniref:Poc4p n=1 Tax=Saccharomycodes ludwigii TaxID=36035 RepID=UPI001E85705B|nr:hypothetical protein SCDLUD_002138 [Saccharomycodes ludwigii]KAH3902318.1 hypothetical protein SCDLUD_002138 [Saccharomycodes ludwigii]
MLDTSISTHVISCENYFYMLITKPNNITSKTKRIPITVTITKTFPNHMDNKNDSGDNYISNDTLSCIYYSVPNVRLQQQFKNNILSTPLQEFTESDLLKEFTKKLSILICNKFSLPSYVVTSSDVNIDSPFQQFQYLKRCKQELDQL